MLPSPSLDQSGNRAANNDLRASEEFVLLEAEIGKLASVHADQAPDWQQVQTLGAHLIPLGHDLHVSCWYSLSCLQLQGCSPPPRGRVGGGRRRHVSLASWTRSTRTPSFERLSSMIPV